jgi:pimeloyl-ACP methyl ester carboxylesterase
MSTKKSKRVVEEVGLESKRLADQAASCEAGDLADHQGESHTAKIQFARESVRQRGGPRAWPPIPHKDPVTFNAGQEAVGILKSVTVELLPQFQDLLQPGSVWTCDQLREFDLSFYVPLDIFNRKDATMSDVLIMVNGLNEVNYIHYAHYDRIGAHLASQDIGAILHPTPFHLNRTAYLHPRFKTDYESYPRIGRFPDTTYPFALQKWPADPVAIMNRLPSCSLMRQPASLFRCFEQTAGELASLARILTGDKDPSEQPADREFFNRFFDRTHNTRVSLLGYSLGGLQALYAFLREPRLFHRCILINSGAKLQDMRTKPVRITSRQWARIVRIVGDYATNMPREVLEPAMLYDILCHRPFEHTSTKQQFRKHVDRIFFVAGGADIVSPGRYLSQFLPTSAAGRGLNVFQISGLEHPLHNSPVYDRWFPILMGMVEQFVRGSKRETSVRYDKLIRDLRSIRIGDESWATHVRKHDAERLEEPYIDPRDRHLDIRRLLKHLSDRDGQEFLKWYYISKRFFEDDANLVRAVDREEPTDRQFEGREEDQSPQLRLLSEGSSSS